MPNNDPIEQFQAIHSVRERLANDLAESTSLTRPSFEEAVRRADAREAELATDPIVREYYRHLGESVIDRATESDKARQELESLRELEALGLVDSDDLTATEQRIQDFEGESGQSPELKIARYFIGKYLSDEQPATDRKVPAKKAAKAQPADEAKAGQGAEQMPRLEVVYDNKGHISINGEAISLKRKVETSTPDVDEQQVVELRLSTIKFLAGHPGQKFTSKQLWETINPSVPFRSHTWLHACADFLEEEFMHEGKPIISVTKPTENARRKYFELKDFRLNIQKTESELKVDAIEEGVYIFPNGTSVAGKAGSLLHLLERASADKPVVTEDIIGPLYSLPELQKNKHLGTRTVLSGLVSSVRRSVNQDSNFVIHRVLTDKLDPQTHRRYYGYYMEKAVASDKRKTAENKPISDPAEIENQSDVDQLLSIEQAAIVAVFMKHYGEIFAQHGLEPIPGDLVDRINNAVVSSSKLAESPEELREERQNTLERMRLILNDNEILEAMVNAIPPGDPREDLLIYLLDIHSIEERWALLDQLLKAHTETEVDVQFSRRKGFAIVGIRHKTVGTNGEPL